MRALPIGYKRPFSIVISAIAVITAVSAVTAGCGGGSSKPSGGGGGADGGGPSADASNEVGCSAYASREIPLETFLGPDGLEQRLLAEINAAQSELFVLLYLVTLDSFTDAFIAAQRRGVDVRVILDYEHPGNDDSRAALDAAGVPLRDAPSGFTNAHTKTLLIDGKRAVIMSANLSFSSMRDERNYGVIDKDPEDIDDVRAIFLSDWAQDGGYPNLECTRLLVSPVNARARLLEHIARAERTLYLSVMYMSDDAIETAVIARSEAGVDVRVLLADPQWVDANNETIPLLQAASVPVRVMRAMSLHSKLVLADGVPFVGSENLSFTSLNRNREIGVIVNAQGPAALARDQFDSDWARGEAP